MTSLRTAVAFREERRPSTLPAHNREHTSMAAHNPVALLSLPMNVQSSSACSSMISKSRNIRWLKRFAAVEARSSHRAMVWREWPVTRAVAEMLTPSTRRLATWSDSLRAQRRPLYAVPVFVLTGPPADRAAVPPASAPLRRKQAVAHDVEAQFSTVVTPALGAGHPVDRVHRSSVPGGTPRFSPKISEVKATDQQRPAHAPQNELLPLDRLASELGVHVCTLQAAAAHEDGVVFGKMPFSRCRKRGLGFYRWVPAC